MVDSSQDTPTQDNRPIAISTVLPKDTLLLRSFRLREELAQPFTMELDMQSTDPSVDFSKVVGSAAAVSIQLGNKQKRYISGIISHFVQGGMHHDLASYHGTLVPWLWLLSKCSNCRIYQNENVISIVTDVLKVHGFTNVITNLGKPTTEYPAIPFCVQYDETDLNFVARLLESEGIWYYFEQTSSGATLVLCDAESRPSTYPGYEEIYYNPQRTGPHMAEHIYEWYMEKEVFSTSVALEDYNYHDPRTDLLETSSNPSSFPNGPFARYNYPGGYQTSSQGAALASVRLAEQVCHADTRRGTSNVRGLTIGYKFKFSGFPRKDQAREYLVASTEMDVITADFSSGESDDAQFSCVTRFHAVPADAKFTPRRRAHRPKIQGPQTAVVVGTTPGSQVATDDYGNVWVRFHWVRDGQGNSTSSCPVRVSQAWAGKSWGSMLLPHIDDEVIVDFEEGDPDRPIITGRVYNAVQQRPKSPKENPMLGYFLDSSTKNLIQMDATAGAEKLIIQNGNNCITMDSKSSDPTMVLTDGKSNITFFTNKGNVKTHNAEDASHWTKGDWSDWVGGVKVSNVVGEAWNAYAGAYTKLVAGIDAGMFLGARLEWVIGFIFKRLDGWEVKNANYGKAYKGSNRILQYMDSFTKWLVKVEQSANQTLNVTGTYALRAGVLEENVTGARTAQYGTVSETVTGIKRVQTNMLYVDSATGMSITSPSEITVDAVNLNIVAEVIEIG